MYYAIISLRESKEINGKPCLLLCDDVMKPVDEHSLMWEAWNSCKAPSGYDTYDDQYGKTYAFYTPLLIDGKKLGVIGVEVEIAKINRGILLATVRQVLTVATVLIFFMLMLLSFIRRHYIRKLIKLRNIIEEYSHEKNPEVANRLLAEVTNKDEISMIMSKFADMILELNQYMQSLIKTRADLQHSRKKAVELNELAMTDPLTGIRNKNGYDKEVQKIEWEISGGINEFGVAMVDLNFLKKINDTFGHDKGNIAIITLSKIVCNTFEHSPVFRIGGDEFVVILKERDLAKVDELVADFNNTIQDIQENPNLEYWEKTSAAIGYSVFDPKIDSAYDNVFKRADSLMYKNKKAMKAVREA